MRVVDAVSFGTLEDLAEALRAGGNPNAYDHHKLTPLHWAMSRFSNSNQNVEKIRLLLEAGANPNAIDATGNTPMVDAVTDGRMDLIELLRRFGASLKCESDCGSLIADAVLGRQLQLIPFLVREGVEINLISRDGFTPLMLAAGNGVADAIPVLLANGAKVDLRDSNHGLTAYLHAALVGDKAAGRMLIEAGADPSARTNDGKTATALATENGHDWSEFPVGH
jgi:ankyrin repeat protein